MVVFQDIEDVSEWLDPLGYIDFWNAVAPYRLTLQDRDFCDAQIASGEVAQPLVLSVLKSLARIELTGMFALKRREILPPSAYYLGSYH